METIAQILAKHPFFAEFDPEYLELVAGCGRNCRFNAGEYLFREGDPADTFFLIRHGMVALEIAVPGRQSMTIATLREGEIVGVSWLLQPYRCVFDARAVELTRAISLDAKCLRGKLDEDPVLGYEMVKRFLPILTSRLHATRLQLLDIYGKD